MIVTFLVGFICGLVCMGVACLFIDLLGRGDWMKKMKFHEKTKALVFEMLMDKCEELEKKYPLMEGEKSSRAFDYLTRLIPEDGAIEVTAKDWFGYGLAVGFFFGGCYYLKKGERDEREPKDNE